MTCRLVVPPAGQQCPPVVPGDPSSPHPPPPRHRRPATGQGQVLNDMGARIRIQQLLTMDRDPGRF
jgi:hypothetical protein